MNNTNQSEKNIVWHARKTSYQQRCNVMGQRGGVFWLTGLSGSGKSTIAMETDARLTAAGWKVYVLDGDNIRHGLNHDLGFSMDDRRENIRRVAEVAHLFADAGIITLVSFISPLQCMRDDARNLIGENFFEIFVDASLDTCRARDPKGLYQKNLPNFTGVDSLYQPPHSPDLVLSTEFLSVDECSKILLDFITNLCKL